MGERPPTPPGRANGDGTNGRVHFSVFEVDLSAGELRKSGLKIKLQGQPFEVLALLLERPEELVTREELHQKFSTSKPRLMFKSDQFLVDDGPNRTWDISPDGQRFLMVRYGERKPQPVTEFILVQNWFEELKHLAPTGKK